MQPRLQVNTELFVVMTTAVNNIAATFSAASRSSPQAPTASTVALSAVSARPSFALWNPHYVLPRSRRSSLLGIYGLPGPRPRPLRLPRPSAPPQRTISAGDRLPDATLSYLDRSGAVRTVSISGLTRGRRAVIMAVPGAFAPPRRPRWWSGSGATFGLSPEGLVKRAAEMKQRGGGGVVVACVAANDVYVMRSWGEQLGAAEAGVTMLSDPDAELARALGLALDLRGGTEGFGIRSEGYLLVAADGVVKALFRSYQNGGGAAIVGSDDVFKVL
ncbi:hypothetical protein B296_00043830 [Ensete ventricosum]|uniref:glutaredoxin-dependent peroxiredoxin n=1 Tax=Ensete ventricosum TaxID=4639 RepID=A0A426YR65_ENSVE|nr:hypothetical protein B296_00043830 [Ensete ventricosum]